MLVANVLQSQGPDGPLGVRRRCSSGSWLSGALVAAVYTAVSLGISSLTDRRAIASAGVLLTIARHRRGDRRARQRRRRAASGCSCST